MVLLPLAQAYDDVSCRAANTATTGTSAPSGRCCVIDGAENVIGVCNADPALETHPQGQLIASDHAGFGDRYVARVFRRRHAIVSSGTKTGIATAGLPIPGSPPGSPAVSMGAYPFPSPMLRVGDAVPQSLAVPGS